MGLLSAFKAHRSPISSPISRDTPSAWLDPVQRAALLVTIALFSASYAPLGLACVLGAVFAEGIAARTIPWRRSPVDFLLIAFIAVYLISGALSSYRLIATGETVLLAVTIYFTFGPLYQLLQRDKNFLTPFL